MALQLNNQRALTQYVSAINNPASPQFGSSLSVNQFVASYSPTAAAQVQQVVAYLNGQGFSNVQVEPNNLFVTADGTVSTRPIRPSTPSSDNICKMALPFMPTLQTRKSRPPCPAWWWQF